MKKVVLVKYTNTNNLGDKVIFETTKMLVDNICNTERTLVSDIELYPNKKLKDEINQRYRFINKEYKGILLLIYSLFWIIKYIFFKKQIQRYLNSKLSDADVVIFCGGGIVKCNFEFFSIPISYIINFCEKKKIPVMLNAVGIEGYDDKNIHCKILKRFLNKECVKIITTRDDLETLGLYVSDKNKIDLVGDSALWSKEKYTITSNKEDLIGVGVIRGKIFSDYGENFSEDEIINAYIGIIKELENRNYKWQLFCNGIPNDYKLGIAILEKMGLPVSEEYLALRPKTTLEFVDLINKYKAIICARMHANIIATSLNIPSVGLIWNKKIELYGEIINKVNRFIKKDDFKNPEFVVVQLEEALKNKYDEDIIRKLKEKTVEKLSSFLANSIDINLRRSK